MLKTIRNSHLSVSITTRGAEITSALAADGFEFIRPRDGKWGKSAPILFPICGTLKNNEYTLGGKRYEMTPHGFISSSDFSVECESEGSLTLKLSSSSESLKVYPFELEFTATYTLDGNTLRSTYAVKNNSDAPMPFMIGLHPAFALPLKEGAEINEHKIDFGKSELPVHPLCNGNFVSKESYAKALTNGVYSVNEEEICKSGTVVFANAPNKVRLFTEGAVRNVSMEYSPEFSYFCIWKRSDPTDKYLCLEPWTSIPSEGVHDECFDARDDMFTLQPGEEMSFFCNITFTF